MNVNNPQVVSKSYIFNKINIGFQKIKELPRSEKFFIFFWLVGPFVYLIERSPADIWLSFLGISFIYKCFISKNWHWLNQWWVKSVLIFWIIAIFSSVIGFEPEFSVPRAIAWIRFPLYAAAAQIWLGRDKDIRFLMMCSLLLGAIIMMIFISHEFFTDAAGNFSLAPNGRLTGPYGDHVPGGYFAKVCLLLFCTIVALINKRNLYISGLSLFFSILIISHTIMTGERGHVLILICSAILALCSWKPNLKKLLIMLIVIFSIFSAYFIVYQKNLTSRFNVINLSESLPFNFKDENPYWGAWRSGIQQGLTTPIFGIGANGTRKTCKDLPPHWLPGKNYCGNHPHNFYVQLFAETGLVGLLFGLLMHLTIIKTCWNSKNNKEPGILEHIAYIIPLAFLFPIQNHGNYFGQWGNLFIWFGIALALAQNQNWGKKIKSDI